MERQAHPTINMNVLKLSGIEIVCLLTMLTVGAVMCGCSSTGGGNVPGIRMVYPRAAKVDQSDDYHGTRVADPYRWLEDDNSADTKAWVEAENKITFDYLGKIPERESIKR